VLSSEFNNEMGALIRSLEQKVRVETAHRADTMTDAQDHLDRAIVSLIALRIELGRQE
jgi:hypothetical protein